MKQASLRKLIFVILALAVVAAAGVYAQKRQRAKLVVAQAPTAAQSRQKPAPDVTISETESAVEDAAMAAKFSKLVAGLDTKPVPAPKPPAASGDLFTIVAPTKASVAPYKVSSGLSNVANRASFAQILNNKQRAMIARNGFTVSPTDYIQIYEIYEVNTYARPLEIPNFITADAMLHTYHMFYDFSLRTIESQKLYDYLEALTWAMLRQSEKDYREAKSPKVKAAAKGNVGFFSVAWRLLGKKGMPSYASTEVEADLKKIEAHKGRAISEVLGVGMDFSQFVPRGHYTRSEELKRFFKAMMWYGLAPHPLPDPKEPETIEQCRGLTIRAILVTRGLQIAQGKPGSVYKLWQSIYEPTAFYVGVADDLTPGHYEKISDRVYGQTAGANAFGDDAKLSKFIAEAEKLPGPGIKVKLIGIPGGKQFRFMGQRFILDSRILQEMCSETRMTPSGMDVPAALGSKRASDITFAGLASNQKSDYTYSLAKMRKEVANIKLQTWTSNLYYGWLWSLWPMVRTHGTDYPGFMTNQAWTDRSLNCALGSWAELRHDTILYAKQSGVECGDGEEEKKPPLPKGYVEPNVELWSRLLWLTEKTEAGLTQRNLLSPALAERFDWMAGWLAFLRGVSIKELSGKELTKEEYTKIKFFGPELENQMMQLYEGSVMTDADKNMAVVADVHTSLDTCLEEGVGHPAAIYVVVPIGGKLYLTRGAVFTYYEFGHPVSDRLTDEKWQKMIDSPQVPPLPDWTRSFIERGKTDLMRTNYSVPGGC